MSNINSQETKPHELRIMPNTGHHYFFIPFSQQFLAQHNVKTGELARKWRSNNSAWKAVPKKNFDKKTPPPAVLAAGGPAAAAAQAALQTQPEEQEYYTWMRYRFGYKGGAQNLGLWLAIESNIGSIERGTLFDEQEIAADAMPANPKEYTVTPYAYPNTQAIGKNLINGGNKNVKDAYSIILPVELNGRVVPFEQVDIIWQDAATATVDVDLIVDFGNTRTVVLALENIDDMTSGGSLDAICKEIRFLPRGQEYPNLRLPKAKRKFESMGETIADSWFLLQQPMFAEWDYPAKDGTESPFRTSKHYWTKEIMPTDNESGLKNVMGKLGLNSATQPTTEYYCTQRVPQMFVEISPALMGDEAKRLMNNIDLNRGMRISMSSPKRYLWDREKQGLDRGQDTWHLNFNSWSSIQDRASLPSLQGQICRYMYEDGSDWDIEHPPFEDEDRSKRPPTIPTNATYPRSMAMVWSALSIIESAYRQITSFNWRDANKPNHLRRLRSVNITFPSGWIAKERQYYRQAWQQAVDIFTLAHMDTRQSIMRDLYPGELARDVQGQPKLCVDLDEAVASQLPFIYSEISRLPANQWIELYGRNACENNRDQTARVRVMTVDIGGGTLDTAIVEYRNDAPGGAVALRYKVLFRDSSTFAGDNVALAIIESVLLKSFLDARGIPATSDNKIAAAFKRVLSQAKRTQADRAKWQRIVTLLFLPIVRQWLSDVANFATGYYQGEEGIFRSIEECGGDENVIKEFNEYLEMEGIDENFVQATDRLQYNPDDINACIEDNLKPGIEPLGKFTAAYDVDVVTISGKISEMPKVEELLRRFLPICPQCIVRMKDYMAGNWYPMSDNGRINDAKTVTAVGAALYTAGKNQLLSGLWNIEEDLPADPDSTTPRVRNYWGLMPTNQHATGFEEEGILLEPQDNSNEHKYFMANGTRYEGTPVMLNNYIGRQKYHAETTMPERLYKLRWTGRPEQAPRSKLAIVIERVTRSGATAADDFYALDEDDIVLRSVEPTDPRDKVHFDPSKVELQLRTLSDNGFWMEECRFHMDI